jgi:hypothetical protein
MADSRELVLKTLSFSNPERAPRQLWILPWAQQYFPDDLARINTDFPPDIVNVPAQWKAYPPAKGNPFEAGEYTDEWGCVFHNIQPGVIGEVKYPIVKNWNKDADKIHIPREWLTLDVDEVNRAYEQTDKFVMAAACPRPFEQLQFLRKTENLYMDLLELPDAMLDFLKQMHSLYCEIMELWASTKVDCLMFMDDWGSQNSLLISPGLWQKLFKPMYRDYIDIAHGAGKKIFMHSDGYILPIMPDLVEMGLDAVNSQVFCMSPEALSEFAGKITFWGEMDRQHILAEGNPDIVHHAVNRVYKNLWHSGGCIAQCEFGPGAKPENVYQVFSSWDQLTKRNESE